MKTNKSTIVTFAQQREFVKKNAWSRASFDSLARAAWVEYQAEIRQRASVFAPLTQSYFDARADESFVIPLNSHVPVLLSEVFGELDQDKVKEITIGHLYLDTFTQVLDDIADKNERSDEQIHLSHLLLLEGLRRLQSAISFSPDVVEKMQLVVEDTMAAERSLWSHKQLAQPYSALDYQIMGRRGGILRCAAHAYGACASRPELVPAVEQALLSGALAVQLVDDLLDWQDDLNDHIYTSPLVGALLSLRRRTADDCNVDDIARALLVSGSANQTLDRASTALHNGRSILQRLGGHALSGLFQTLQFRLEELRGAISNLAALPMDKVTAHILCECLKRSGDTRLEH